MKRASLKNTIRVLGFLLGIAAFFLALRSIPLEQLRSVLLANLDGSLLFGLAAWMMSILLQTKRWQIMLHPQKPVAFDSALKFYILNRLTNLLFVFRAGEGVRVVAASRKFQINMPYLIATIINERILNIAFLAVMTFALTFSLPFLAPYRSSLAAGLLVLIAGAVWFLRHGTALREPRRRQASIANSSSRAHFLRRFAAGIAVLREPRVFQGSVLTSFGSWVCLWFGIWALLQGLQPANSLLSALAVLLLINIAGILPLTPSNVGPFQWACILALAQFGVPHTEAVAFSIVLQGVRILAAVLIGLCLFLRDLGISRREVANKNNQVAEATF